MSTPQILKLAGLLVTVLGMVFLIINLLNRGTVSVFPIVVSTVGLGTLIAGYYMHAKANAQPTSREVREGKGQATKQSAPVASPGGSKAAPAAPSKKKPRPAPPPERAESPPAPLSSKDIPMMVEDDDEDEPAPLPDEEEVEAVVLRNEAPPSGRLPQPGSYLTLCPACGKGFVFSPRQLRKAVPAAEDSKRSKATTNTCGCGLNGTIQKTGAGDCRVSWWL